MKKWIRDFIYHFFDVYIYDENGQRIYLNKDGTHREDDLDEK